MTPKDDREDHIAEGWNESQHLRWIEVGPLRLDESDEGAVVTVRGDGALSAHELASLVRLLAGWFTEDPIASIRQIENHATYVNQELEVWNARARIDEVHPPYEKLTQALDWISAYCKQLREDLDKFADKTGGA